MRRSFDPAALLERIVKGEATCRDLAMRIDRDGVWHHEGRPIRRPELVRLFASVLHRAPDGSFWLVTPVEQGRIEVEDAPFLAVELDRAGQDQGQCLRLRTNLDEWVTMSCQRPLLMRRTLRHGDVPYLQLRPMIEARIVQPIYYELAELAVPAADGSGRLGVWSDGTFFPMSEGGPLG